MLFAGREDFAFTNNHAEPVVFDGRGVLGGMWKEE